MPSPRPFPWLSTLALTLGLSAAAGCGSSENHGHQPSSSGSGGSGDVSEAGSGGTLPESGGTGTAGTPANGGAGSAGNGASGGATHSGGSGAVAGAGQGGAAGAAGTLAPHALAATPHGTCALDAAGKIACWGLSPETWDIPGGTFTELYSGRANDGTVCGVRADHTVACFAEPFGISGMDVYPKVPVKTLAIGLGVVCGIDTGGATFCNAQSSALSIDPPADEDFSAVSVGNQFGCGIRTSDRTILCWSAELFGSCDYSPPDNQLAAPSGAYQDISSGAFTTCAVATDGSAKCWGVGDADDDPDAMCFTAVSLGQAEPPAGKFRTVATGNYHTCALGEDGRLSCWGAGTTVNCTDDDINCGQSIPPGGRFEQVTVGLYHSCAMRADRTIACWGYDGDGDGRTTPPEEFQ